MRKPDRRISAYLAIGASAPGAPLSPFLSAALTSYLQFAFEVVICDASGDDASFEALLALAQHEARLRLLRASRQGDDRLLAARALAREACRGAYVFEGAPERVVIGGDPARFDALQDRLSPEYPAIALPLLHPQDGGASFRRDLPLSTPCFSRNDPTLGLSDEGALVDRCSAAPVASLETLPASVVAMAADGSDMASFANALDEATRALPVVMCFERGDVAIPSAAAAREALASMPGEVSIPRPPAGRSPRAPAQPAWQV